VPHSPPHSVSSPGRGGGSPSAAGGDDLCPHPISAGPHPSSGPIPPANSLCPLCRRGSISPVPFLHRCSYAPCSACPFCLREHAGLFLRALPMPVPFRPLLAGRHPLPCDPLRLAVPSGHKPVPPGSYFFDFVALSLCPNAPSPPLCLRRSILVIHPPSLPPPPLSLDRCVFFHHMQMPRICTRPSPPPPRSSYETILSSRASPPRGRAPRPSSPTSILYGPHTVPPSRVPRSLSNAQPSLASLSGVSTNSHDPSGRCSCGIIPGPPGESLSRLFLCAQ